MLIGFNFNKYSSVRNLYILLSPSNFVRMHKTSLNADPKILQQDARASVMSTQLNGAEDCKDGCRTLKKGGGVCVPYQFMRGTHRHVRQVASS